MRKTKEEAEVTRQAILQSAMDTFYEKGYSKTTFDEIAKRINLTKGAVYWHFRNKPDLIAAIINDYFEKQRAYIEERQPVIQSFDDIISYFLHHIHFMLNNENNYKVGFFLICQMEWSEAILQRVSAQIKDIRSYPLQLFKETLTLLQKRGEINPNVNIEELASLSMYMWRGIMSSYISKADPMSLSQMMLRGFDLIMDGIKMESKTDD